MSRKIKVQTVNTDNLEKTLKENICTKTLETNISPALIEKARKIMDKLREEDNDPCNDNTGDASAYTNKDDNSTVVNIHDIKIKNLIERFNDIVLDITTDDFTDDMSMDDRITKMKRRDGIVTEQDMQLFIDIINNEEYDDFKDIPIDIEAIIYKLHGTISSLLYRQIAGYYNFLIEKLNINIESITKKSYYFKLAYNYINKWKSEFNVPDEDLNKLSETAGTNYNIIKEKINEINNRPNDYAKCRAKANQDSYRFNKNDCTTIKPVNDITKEFIKGKEIGEAFRDFKSKHGVTKYGNIKDVKKVLNSVEKPDVNQPGELFLSIPQDYEAPSITAKINPCNMEVDNNTAGTDINYEHVNHPSHYNNYDKEVIDMMINIWGKEQTAIFCKLNAFKYRMRMGTKPENDILQDLKKEKWYLAKYNELIM